MLLPTYNEDPHHLTARLSAMYESVTDTGRGACFDWFLLSDTTRPGHLDTRGVDLHRVAPCLRSRTALLPTSLGQHRPEIRKHRRVGQTIWRSLRLYDRSRRGQPDGRRRDRPAGARDGIQSHRCADPDAAGYYQRA